MNSLYLISMKTSAKMKKTRISMMNLKILLRLMTRVTPQSSLMTSQMTQVK